MKKQVDRTQWKTSLELAQELGYTDRGTVANILAANKVSKVRNPDSPLPHSLLYNRDEFLMLPMVVRRLVSADDMEQYDKELWLEGDYMITADWHIPFHDVDLVEKMLAVAEKFGAKKLVIAGDFIELDVFKTYIDKTAAWKYEKQKTRSILKALLGRFREIVWLIGNHEVRMWKRLQGMGEEEDIFQLILEAEAARKVRYSIYPYTIINSSWMVVHPKSYSRIQARNAFFLASKYLVKLVERGKSPNGIYGMVAAHGHLGGMGTDISGRFQVADGMGMMNPDKVHYQIIKISTSPNWRPGFFMLLDNTLYPFPKDGTDWRFWMEKITYG